MARREHFDDAFMRARNHIGEMTGESKLITHVPRSKHSMGLLLKKQSAEGGHHKDVFKGSTLDESMIGWDEHKRRERHRWLEENG